MYMYTKNSRHIIESAIVLVAIGTKFLIEVVLSELNDNQPDLQLNLESRSHAAGQTYSLTRCYTISALSCKLIYCTT